MAAYNVGFTGNFAAPNGQGVDFGTAQKEWAKLGFDLSPDGKKTKIGAAPAPAPAQGGNTLSLGGGLKPGAGASVVGGGVSVGVPSGLADLTAIADPWSTQRGQYQTQLSDLMKNPGAFSSSPLFKASQDAGIEAVNRSAAAKGMLGSGNRLQALMDYGQKNAPDNFFRMADLLSGLGGAKNQNPGGGISGLAQLAGAETGQYNAQTSRMAQEQGVNQFNTLQKQQTDETNLAKKFQQQQLAQQQQDNINKQNQQRWQAQNNDLERIRQQGNAMYNNMTFDNGRVYRF